MSAPSRKKRSSPSKPAWRRCILSGRGFLPDGANGGTFSFSAKVTTKPQISISKVGRCSFFFDDSMYNGGREFVKMKNNGVRHE